jgi:uncharacterized protein YggE
MKNTNAFLKENKVLSTYILLLLATLVFLWLINFFNISYPLSVTSRTASGELAVVGVGKVDTAPDTASVDLGIVVTDAKTIDEAQGQINKINNAIVEGVKGLNIDKSNIKTSNYSIVPNYDYSKGGNGVITGYNGNATVTIKVKDTNLLPQVINAGTKAGANTVMGTNYTIDNPENFQEQARAKAIANAKEQAKKLASELGIHLGNITNIVESSNNPGPVPMMEKSVMRMDAGTNVPSADLQPGTQTITSTVTLYFDKR